MQLHIKVDEGGVIEDAKFKCFGCGSAIASSSWPPSGSRGARSTKRSRSRTPRSWRSSTFPRSRSCSVLAEDSIRHAIADYKKKNGVVDDAKTHSH